MRSILKKVTVLALFIGIISSLNASDYRASKYSNYNVNNDVYTQPYNPYVKNQYRYKKHYKKHKRMNQIRYYDTNNPNITIMVKNSRHVSKREIRRALKRYLAQNFYSNRYWR